MSLLDKASLVQIPSGYKATKLYSVVPDSGAGDLSFARSSSATRVNESGIIETIAIDTPRIDYTGGGCGKLLIEPQSTNLLPYSEQLNQLILQQGAVVSSQIYESPAGDNSACLVDLSGGSSARAVENKGNNATEYTLSVYLRKHENDADGTFPIAYYDGSDYQKTYLSLTSNWQRFSITFTNPSSGPIGYGFSRRGSTGLETLTRAYAWGMQIEESEISSYIPTSGAASTRTQDSSVTTGLSSLIGQVGGVLYLNVAAQNNSINGRISIGDGSFDNRVMVSYNSTPNQIRVQIASGGSNVFSQNYTLTNATDFNKIAVKWNLNDFSVWVNSIEVLTGNSGNIPLGMDTLSFNRSGSNSRYFYGEVKELAVFFTALTDTELAALTTI